MLRVAAEVEEALERSLQSWSRSELRALYRALRRYNQLTEVSKICEAVPTKSRYEIRCLMLQLRALDYAENPKRMNLRDRFEVAQEREKERDLEMIMGDIDGEGETYAVREELPRDKKDAHSSKGPHMLGSPHCCSNRYTVTYSSEEDAI